jgi:hypothetical protein
MKAAKVQVVSSKDQSSQIKKTLAIIGGGPSGLFILQRMLKAAVPDWSVHIFEQREKIGPGMPYSAAGSNREHVTNVSDNEVPELITDLTQWIKQQPRELLDDFEVDPITFHEYKVLPRLLFGKYLADQFVYIKHAAQKIGLELVAHCDTEVTDLIDLPEKNKVKVIARGMNDTEFDHVIVCTGHRWSKKNEGKVANYFDSPYPPEKLNLRLNHPVAIRGSSLSAIDAIKTLARSNGTFSEVDGKLTYIVNTGCEKFRIILHSRDGMLPAFRVHLDKSNPESRTLLTAEEIDSNRKNNNGFLSLDYVFDYKFKRSFTKTDPEFYEQIKDWSLETFVESMLELRESLDPFTLFNAEHRESERSIQRRQSIPWKEALAELSFILNYPAKYLSAEDTLRLQHVLKPLISVIIAFVPQSSGQELITLHEAGVLSLKPVKGTSTVLPELEKGGATYSYDDPRDPKAYFHTYVDCVGQVDFSIDEFPFQSLIKSNTIAEAKVKFESQAAAKKFETDHEELVSAGNHGERYLKLPGIAINDDFQVMSAAGSSSQRIYIMAVPFIGGFNPDYSGLDFCDQASRRITSKMLDRSNAE